MSNAFPSVNVGSPQAFAALVERTREAYERASAASPGGDLLPWGSLDAGLRGLLCAVGSEMEDARERQVRSEVMHRAALAYHAELSASLPQGTERAAVLTAAELSMAGAVAVINGRRLPPEFAAVPAEPS